MKFIPSESLNAPNDKLTKIVFSLTSDEFQTLLQGDVFTLRELKNKNHAKIIRSPFWMKFDNPADARPFDLYDRAILSACISEFSAGHNPTSLNVIFRLICGKPSGKMHIPTQRQKAEIKESIERLRGCKIKVDMSAICAARKRYNGGNPFKMNDFTPILPCHFASGNVGGYEVDDAIFFDAESPLMKVARAKNYQVATFDYSLLDTGEKHNTRATIAANFYVLLRVKEILNEKSRLKTPVITFADVFDKCRITDASRDIKKTCRDAIKKIMENLQSASVVNSFKLIKKESKFYSVKFEK